MRRSNGILFASGTHALGPLSGAIQLKLDELIRSSRGAHNGLLDLEELSEAELDAFRAKYVRGSGRRRSREHLGQASPAYCRPEWIVIA